MSPNETEGPYETEGPFVGRVEDLALAGRALRGRYGHGVVMAGPAGVGKSRLAAEVVRRLDGVVVRVAGTRSGSVIPFSAFAWWLPPSPVDDLAPVLRRLSDRLHGKVLVVDDAHLLDPASATLVHQLVLHRVVRLVATVRNDQTGTDAVTALWKDDLLPRIELAPLGRPELAQLLTAVLGDHVEARTVTRMSLISQGDLRLLAELVASGVLVRRRGVWAWEGEPPATGRLRELVVARIGDLDEEEREVLAYLAFGEPLPAETLARLVPAGPVERLEARGLLVSCAGGLAGALHGEVVRMLFGPLRARRVKRRLAEVFEPVDPQNAARVARWRLDAGGTVPPALLAEGCRQALACLDVPLAVRLGTVAGQHENTEAEVIARIVAASGGRDPLRVLHDESARVTARILAGDLGTEPTVGEDAAWDLAAAAFCGHKARLCRLRGELSDALAWSRDGLRRLPGEPAGFAGLCLGELAHAAALTGDLPTARSALAEAMDRGGGCSADLARTWVLAATGDREAAIHAALASAERADRCAVFALHDVVRLGAPGLVADPLRWHSDQPGCGPLIPVLARHAAACAALDGATLDIVAKEFEAIGMLLHAAEAYAHASHAHASAGAQRQARAAAARGALLARACQGALTPALTQLATPALTLRQREIAQLAATGLSNREIANRLTVSIRTVANHLCGVYDRLGVHDRSGLARLLSER
jgi:DNA-binding CsgD family transcriptional regulator